LVAIGVGEAFAYGYPVSGIQGDESNVSGVRCVTRCSVTATRRGPVLSGMLMR